jgi:F0F1-type ATP synthase alpha subunit
MYDQIIPAETDPTGRTVHFPDGTRGVVVAHRDPISFVLAECPPGEGMEEEGEGGGTTTPCTISTEQTAIRPDAILPGMIVDYLGRALIVNEDGSVRRCVEGVGGERDGHDVAGGEAGEDDAGGRRPIFVPIPKISDIGLIDSPLVTGITAIDALTPIGKGQNMLVIGEEEEDGMGGYENENNSPRLNKRGWMINLLRNVVVNHRGGGGGNRAGGGCMRCFYCLTSVDPKVRRFVLDGIAGAGICDDVVTVLSSSNPAVDLGGHGDSDESDVDDFARVCAAEAVAVAATTCTLAEHHARTTGGDAVVIVDDINLHKSLWDVTTRELVGVFGINSVVEADLNGGSSSEMRGYFSGLIQRAARYNAKNGGGSVTIILLSTLPRPDDGVDDDDDGTTFDASDFDAMSEKIRSRIRMLSTAGVPLTATNLRRVKLPVPMPSAVAAEDLRRLALQHVEDLISMSDGQVWLDAGQIGRSPPLDPSRSITRVGVGADTRTCRADAPALRSVVGSLRFEFQQAMDLSPDSSSSPSRGGGASSSSGAVDEKDSKQVRRRDAFLLAMHQESNEGRKLSSECLVLLAASRGHLDSVLAKGGMAGTSKGKEAIEGMLEYVNREAGEMLRLIDETLELSSEDMSALEEVIKTYLSTWR